MKGSQFWVNPTLSLMHSPNYVSGSQALFESKILVKSPKPRIKAQRKVDHKNYDAITMSRNYEEKLLHTGNYEEKLLQEIIS